MPTGQRLTDGFATLITFSLSSTIALWEMTVKPPGGDAGGPNDTTTMRNTAWRTRQPKHLKTLTSSTGKCAYDPKILNDLVSMLGKNQLITYTYPDGSTWKFWGWLDKFEPDEIKEGAMPEASYTIEPGNQDNTGAEVAPTYTTGTTTTTTTTTTP